MSDARTDELIAQRARQWVLTSAAEMRAALRQLGLRDTGRLLRVTRGKLRKRGGSVEAVSIGTKRYGMIKLHGIREQVVSTRDGRRYRLSAKPAQDWYSPVIDSRLGQLSDQVAELRADQVVRASTVIENKKQRGS